MENCVRLSQASVSLGSTLALRSISVNITRGQIIGVLGPSGAGKTTLMRVIVGRQNISRGTAEIMGRPAGSAELRGKIGYMPQALAIYNDLTVRENLRYFSLMLGVSRRAVGKLIETVDLGKQASQLAGTLSGGQKARLSLAIALLGDPELLVLDEPTVGVDPVLRARLWELFRVTASHGVTLLISSHVMDEASRCDDLLLIRRGRLLAHGTPSELLVQTKTTTIEDTFLALVGKKK